MNRGEELKEVLRNAGREDLVKEVEGLVTNCNTCDAKCCRYVMLPMIPDKEKSYFEYLIYHGFQIIIDTEDNEIDVLIEVDCDKIGPNNKCNVYNNRPNICKDHANLICFEQNNDVDYIVIKTVEDLNNSWNIIEKMN